MIDQDKGSKADIIYTKVDEAPELASASLLPIIRKFVDAANITVGTMDISLAGRIIANFPENLTPEQRQPDHLAELGLMVNEPDTNVIKLPNINIPISGVADGKNNRQINNTIKGKTVFSTLLTGRNCFISIARSSGVVNNFMIGG